MGTPNYTYAVKGTSLINTKKFIIKKLGEEKYHQLVHDTGFPNLVIPSSWYDFFSVNKISHASAVEMNITLEEFTINQTRYILEVDLLGVYRLFMRVSGVKNVLLKVPKMMSSYTNYWSGEILENGQGKVLVRYLLPLEFADQKDLIDYHMFAGKGAFTGILNICNTPMKSFEIIDSFNHENGKNYVIDFKVVYTV